MESCICCNRSVDLCTKLFAGAWMHLFQSLSVNAFMHTFVCVCVRVCLCISEFVCLCAHTCNQRAIYRNSWWQPECWGGNSNSWLWVILSHDWILHRNTILHFTLTNMLWSVQNLCGLVSCEKHPLVEHCTFVVDLIEQQGDQMAKRLTRSQSVTSLFPVCITNVVVKDIFLCRKKKSYNLVVCIVLVVHMCLNFMELGVSSCWNKVKLKNSASLNKKKHPFHTIS